MSTRIAGAFVAVAAAGFFAWLHFSVGGAHTTLVFDDFGELLAPLLAGALCLRTARRVTDRPRRIAWALIGASALSWGIGQAIWTWYEVGRGTETPFPSAADAGYLGAVPLAIVGVLFLPSAARSATSRIRTFVDSLLVAGAILWISWAVVLGPTFHTTTGTLLEQVIGLAYPAADAATLAIVIVALARSTAGQRVSVSLVGLGLVALALADSFFVYLTVTGAYTSGGVSDTGWFAGYLLIGLAAFHTAQAVPQERRLTDRYRALQLALPYAPIVVMIVITAVRTTNGEGLDNFLLGCGLAIGVLLILRQVLVVVENAELTRSFEESVVELEKRERLFRSLVQHSSDVVTIVDADGVIAYQSASVQPILGYDPAALVGTPLEMVLEASASQPTTARVFDAVPNQGDVALLESRWRHRQAGWRHCETTVTNLLADPSVQGLVLNTRDVTERKDAERELEHQALHDPLTGLPNRALFLDRLRGALLRLPRASGPVAILFIDLDRFKVINDSLGHDAGDEVLTTTSERLRRTLRASDTVARFGGDEFVVLCETAGSMEEALDLAERLSALLRRPIQLMNGEVYITISIGLAMATSADTTAEELIRDADLAMYQAKELGRAQVRVFQPALRHRPVARLDLESSLYRAVERREFSVVYQPIVDLHTGALAGAEALVRWAHPTRGILGPEEFLDIAEETGLIVPIGWWVLEQAVSEQARLLRAARRWGSNGSAAHGSGRPRPPMMTVNLSARQVAQPDLVETVARTVEAAGLPAGSLCLEVNEEVIDDSEPTVRKLEDLRDAGVLLAVDDFGTGYSSLGHLRRFPVTMLKIDKSFVGGLLGDQSTAAIVDAITNMSRALGLTVVAEGVESDAQVAALQVLGCQLGQGYLFGSPGPAAALRRLVERARHPIAPRTASAVRNPTTEPTAESA